MTPLETPPRTVPGAPQAPPEAALQGPKNLGFPFVFKGKQKIRPPPPPLNPGTVPPPDPLPGFGLRPAHYGRCRFPSFISKNI